jgi:hypothetical protein
MARPAGTLASPPSAPFPLHSSKDGVESAGGSRVRCVFHSGSGGQDHGEPPRDRAVLAQDPIVNALARCWWTEPRILEVDGVLLATPHSAP